MKISNVIIATFVILLLIAGAVGALVFLGEDAGLQNDEDRITVAATIFPLADIIENIGGEHVRVMLIVPPGASPHSYSPSPQEIASLQNAEAIFYIGHGLDEAYVDMARNVAGDSRNLTAVSVDKDIVLRRFGDLAIADHHDHDHDDHHDEHEDEHDDHDDHGHAVGETDPHYWLTAPNAQKIAATVAAQLQVMDPDNADSYQQNLEHYASQLRDLETELQEKAQAIQQKDFIAMHDAWSYFAAQYGLELVGTYEPIEGREPSAADIRALQQVIGQHGITAFYTEPQKASTPATRLFQRDLGLSIKVLDPVGGMGATQSYIELMRYNIEVIAASE